MTETTVAAEESKADVPDGCAGLPPSLCHENIKYEAQKQLVSQEGTHGSENNQHGKQDHGYREDRAVTMAEYGMELG